MIDWVSAIIPFEHEPLNGGYVSKITPDGEIEWETRCRVSVRGSFDRDISFRSGYVDKEHGVSPFLIIDGNPSKFLQGHNIFGSDNLLSLVFDTVLAAAPILGLDVPNEALELIRAGEYRLTRVDINKMYELPSIGDVNSWLRAAEFKSKTRHGRPSSKGGTLYWGKSSRRWSIKAYSKGEELRAGKSHKLPDGLIDTELFDFAQNKLRVELTLRGKELDEIGMSTAKTWLGMTPLKLFAEYVTRIEMNEQIELSDQELNKLPRYLRGTYSLWKNGHNPRELLSKPTFYKHRRVLLEHGIDINLSVEKIDRSNVVPLIRVIQAVPVSIPDWAFEQNLVHPSTVRSAHYG